MGTVAQKTLTRRQAIASLFDFPMDRKTKASAVSRIQNSKRVSQKTKGYLLDLLKRKPNNSVLMINLFLRAIPQIVTENGKRRSLGEFLKIRGEVCFLPKPITKQEKKLYSRELAEKGFFSDPEIEKIMREIEKRPRLSESGAHATVHYFICNKILDRIEKAGPN